MADAPYEGFLVAVTRGKAVRVDAPTGGQILQGLQEAELGWVNVEVDDFDRDTQRIASVLGFSTTLLETALRTRPAEYVDLDSELALLVPMIRLEKLRVEIEPLLILVRQNFVLTLYKRGRVTRFQRFARYAETAMRKIPAEAKMPDKLTVLVTRILDENNTRNFEGIRPIADQGERIAGELVNPEIDRQALVPHIYLTKQALIHYLDALWASLEPIQSLRHGDADLVTDEESLLARIGLLAQDVQRHIELSEHVSEVLSGGLEVMQSIYNNHLQALNNRMAFVITWLTILGTAVLVPNTLATILAAAPPSLRIEDPVVYVAVMAASTVLATWGAWMWIRRAGYLPKRLD